MRYIFYTGPKTCNVTRVQSATDPLAMQSLLDKTRLEIVLEATQLHPSKRMGHIGYDPACFGILKDDNAWLLL